MTETVINQIIQSGESEIVEFKQNFTDVATVGKIVCAFLNGRGGMLILGVNESKNILGIAQPEEIKAIIRQELDSGILPNALYSVNVERIADKACLLIEVPAGREVPYIYQSQIFVRIGAAGAQLASVSQISEIIARRYGEPERWERQIALGLTLADMDQEEIRRAMWEASERYSQNSPMDNANALEHWALLVDGQARNSAAVLFANNPANRYPQIRARAVRYAADNLRELTDSRIFSGHAFAMLEQMQNFLRDNVAVSSRIQSEATDFRRTDTPAYPWYALREGLLNAIIHRDYSAYDGAITLSLFPDRLEIWNIGTLPDGATIEDLTKGYASRPHNPDIAHLFFLRGYIERLGSGIPRIIAACLQAGLPEPQWELQSGGIKLTLRSLPATPHDTQGIRMNRRQSDFLRQILPGQRVRAAEYHRDFASDVSPRQARSELNALVAMGYARVEGAGPATSYLRTEKTFTIV